MQTIKRSNGGPPILLHPAASRDQVGEVFTKQEEPQEGWRRDGGDGPLLKERETMGQVYQWDRIFNPCSFCYLF